MAHNTWDGPPPIDVIELIDELSPKEGLVYFIERARDGRWLHKQLPGFTNDPNAALCYKKSEFAEQYLKAIEEGCEIDECVITEHEFVK